MGRRRSSGYTVIDYIENHGRSKQRAAVFLLLGSVMTVYLYVDSARHSIKAQPPAAAQSKGVLSNPKTILENSMEMDQELNQSLENDMMASTLKVTLRAEPELAEPGSQKLTLRLRVEPVKSPAKIKPTPHGAAEPESTLELPATEATKLEATELWTASSATESIPDDHSSDSLDAQPRSPASIPEREKTSDRMDSVSSDEDNVPKSKYEPQNRAGVPLIDFHEGKIVKLYDEESGQDQKYIMLPLNDKTESTDVTSPAESPPSKSDSAPKTEAESSDAEAATSSPAEVKITGAKNIVMEEPVETSVPKPVVVRVIDEPDDKVTGRA